MTIKRCTKWTATIALFFVLSQLSAFASTILPVAANEPQDISEKMMTTLQEQIRVTVMGEVIFELNHSTAPSVIELRATESVSPSFFESSK